jgi:EAL domain-containing protein (putative c-di-GMP-specific phosphodiesterase class I)
MSPQRDPVLLSLDDEPEIGDIIESVARQAGFKAASTQTVDDFYRQLRLLEPDVVVLDLQLADTDGVQVLRHLGDAFVKCGIVLISGMDERTLSAAKTYADSRDLRLLATVQKPFLPEDLLRIFLSVKSVSEPLGVKDFERAVENGELLLHYQPVIRNFGQTWDIDSVEALIRWDHPERGMMKPDSFLKVGEEQGLSRMITDFVIGTALQQLKGWNTRGIRIAMRVNVSAGYTDIEFPDRLHMTLKEYEIDPASIIIEVNETAMFVEQPRTFDILTRLRLKGIGLAIDDFGIGYSSLTQLFRMPFSEMKIDKSLLGSVSSSREGQIAVEALIDLAHKLDLKVCAEGVEDEAALNFLQRAGCDCAQGYLISRPLSSTQIPDVMRRWRSSDLAVQNLANIGD